MNPRRITGNADFAEAVKDRRQAMGLTHADLDHLVGWQDGYASKVEGYDRQWGRRPFNLTVNAADMLQALGLAVVILPVDEARALCLEPTAERRIRQLTRHQRVPHKEVRLTCTLRRRPV